MNKKKTKEQLLSDLIDMQKFLEEKIEVQDRLIGRFQTLIQNEGLFAQVIQSFPYSIAIFLRSGSLIMANHALLKEAKISPDDISKGKINLLSRITTENFPIMEAIEDIFLGETTAISNLIAPFSIFTNNDVHINTTDLQTAIFFPIAADDGSITHGAIMFMK